MTARKVYRLEGLEYDNCLAFLALIGLLRALDQVDETRHSRVSWTVGEPPLRPALHLPQPLSTEALAKSIAFGIARLVEDHDFSGREDLSYDWRECRNLLEDAALNASTSRTGRAALVSALMSDAALKDGKEKIVDPTPLCLLFGQGHQHFLERLAEVPKLTAPPPRGRGKAATVSSEEQCLIEALLLPWHRSDPTPSFRWDPHEDVRYAMMAGDPTDKAYKSGTQHGANRIAAVGLAALTVVPRVRRGRVSPFIVGGAHGMEGFSFAWPIWTEPATLPAILAMLAHPNLRTPGSLGHLGVVEVMIAKRISIGKFMNLSRARSLSSINYRQASF